MRWSLLITANLLAAGPSSTYAAETSNAAATPKTNIGKTNRQAKNDSRKPPVEITSDHFDTLPNAQQAVWTGHVRIVREDVKVDCDKLVADYDDKKNPKKFSCQGHAHLQQPAVKNQHPDREAWGDLAVFENDTALLVVTGSPRAREGANTLRGEKVIYHARTDRLQVEKPIMMVENAPGKSFSPSPTTPPGDKTGDKKP